MDIMHHASTFHIAMLSIHSSPVGELGTRDTGGMSVYIRELAKELGGMGHRVDVFTLDQKTPGESIISLHQNVRLFSLKIDAPIKISKENLIDFLPLVYKGLKKRVLTDRAMYNLVHSHYWLSGLVGEQLGYSWHIPHALTFHTTGAIKNAACAMESEPPVRIQNEKKLSRTCTRLIVSTFQEKNDLVKLYGADENKTGVVPCGVDFGRFQPGDKKSLRSQLNHKDNETIILFVGRYVPVKGLDRLLETMPILCKRNRTRLIIVGGESPGSKEHRELNTKIERLDLTDSVDQVGRIDQALLPVYYSMADVLAIPSYHESFSLVALESLACGTPVAGTRVGDLANMISDCNGRILTEFSPAAFAHTIERVVGETRAGILRRDQIRKSVRNYTWKNTAERTLREYRIAVQGG